MSGFSAEWLTGREPADRAARSAPLTRALAERLHRDDTLRAVDLAAGTGANARYLIERLHSNQDWLLVDHDPALVAEAPRRIGSWGIERGYQVAADRGAIRLQRADRVCRVEMRRVDLAALDAVDVFAGRTLVTASALLDLVSASWLRTLAARCRDSGAAVLVALTYDGRIRCSPEEPEDEAIRTLVNRHQRIDKGFGPALGSEAVAAAARAFADHGYDVRRERSDWLLTPASRDLQREVIDGWADAATAISPDAVNMIHDWQTRRVAHVEAGRSELVVGHQDMAAWLR